MHTMINLACFGACFLPCKVKQVLERQVDVLASLRLSSKKPFHTDCCLVLLHQILSFLTINSLSVNFIFISMEKRIIIEFF